MHNRISLLSVCMPILSLTLTGIMGCSDFLHTRFADTEDAILYQAKEIKTAPDLAGDLLVMTWNIKYSGGRYRFFWECGGNIGNLNSSEVTTVLKGLAAKINQTKPDILLLQEADVSSKRSAYINSVQWLLDHTALNYGAYSSQWKADSIPSDGLGRVDSGNAVLSKWPIHAAQRLAYPFIGDQDKLTQYFYLKRNLLSTSIAIPGATLPLQVLATHTSAFSNDGTKQKQLSLLADKMDDIEAQGGWFISGGDLNSLPPGTVTRIHFPDDCHTDQRFDNDGYEGEETWLDRLYRYNSAIPITDYTANNTPYLSYTGEENLFWSRKLDYLFTNGSKVTGSGLTHQDIAQGGMETIMLSDHAPLSMRLELR